MTSYAFSPPPLPSVPIVGSSARFAVHRIYCVGHNYAAHVREMGGVPGAEPPLFFMKPADAIVADGTEVPYPSRTASLHYEAELVVAIGRRGRATSADAALDFVFGYAVGNDYTRRDLQAEAREARRPWDVAKGFDYSAGIGAIHPASAGGGQLAGRIWLTVNGTLRQQSQLSDLIWDVPAIIVELSTYFELAPGDLIYTGTPAGVGALAIGDEIVAGIDGLGELRQRIGAPR